MEAAGITVGSRVLVRAAKQSSALVRLISGLVRKKGYSRGADNKLLYTISGASTGIRLNEHITYVNSEAARTSTGQLDFTDSSRKADTLLQTNLGALTSDGILSIANLAANSDVETFIASLQVEFGELQDVVNYIEEQSGGEVVIDTNDLVNFRHEIKNTFFGRGFTLKNKYTAATTGDDADDTMYLVHKNWTYEDSFYKSDVYANRLFGILPPDDLDIDNPPSTNAGTNQLSNDDGEYARKFRPQHSHFLEGDIYVRAYNTVRQDPNFFAKTPKWRFRIAIDSGGAPGNVVANIDLDGETLPNSWRADVNSPDLQATNDLTFYDTGNNRISSFNLSTTTDYWFILSDDNSAPTTVAEYRWLGWADDPGSTAPMLRANIGTTSNSSASGGWGSISTRGFVRMPIRRSQEFRIWDPKAVMAVSSGLTGGQFVSTTLSDISPLVKTKDSMYRYLAQQIYNMARPRTSYSFPSVTAPNIPPFPGDPIIISDSVLGFSTAGNQIVQTVCGDMTYTWGAMDAGNYEAPTILSINAIGVHPRYR